MHYIGSDLDTDTRNKLFSRSTISSVINPLNAEQYARNAENTSPKL